MTEDELYTTHNRQADFQEQALNQSRLYYCVRCWVRVRFICAQFSTWRAVAVVRKMTSQAHNMCLCKVTHTQHDISVYL